MGTATRSKLLLFTDLDGTLLDFTTYSCDAVLPALKRLRKCGIPLIINSSKTREEIETMPDLISLSGVFIVENGSAIFFDRDFTQIPGLESESIGRHRVIVLGRSYGDILGGLRQARTQCRAKLKGFSEMSAEEISLLTGLDMESSLRAKNREFSEPFVFEGDQQELDCLSALLTEMGISCIEGGRLSYAIGPTDKGRAAVTTKELYEAAFPGVSWRTAALGDGPNDAAMLRMADVAIIVRRPDGSFLDYVPGPDQQVIISSNPGPEGWNEEVSRLLDEACCG